MTDIDDAERRNLYYDSEIDVTSSAILMHSRTVVEKENFISMGVLSYIEGDVIEVEIEQVSSFNLGDAVKMIIYSPGGMHVFQTTVIARDIGAILVINPPEIQKKFEEKRTHHRVDLKIEGIILSLSHTKAESPVLYENPLHFTLDNISISGIRLAFKAGVKLEYQLGICLELKIDLGFMLLCRIEILRKDYTGEGFCYGARFIDLPNSMLNSLRAFILTKQVETRSANKKKLDPKKREFR